MKILIVVNFHKESELDSVGKFAVRFGDSFRGISNMDSPLASWKMDSMVKDNAEWTKRFLRKFLDEKDFDCLIKIDPDTKISGELPIAPDGCDVGGDFRKAWFGWIWFGGYHFFTKRAAETILSDKDFCGKYPTQDIPLTKSVVRMNLKAYNMRQVNCWKLKSDSDCVVMHRGATKIDRLPEEFVDFYCNSPILER